MPSWRTVAPNASLRHVRPARVVGRRRCRELSSSTASIASTSFPPGLQGQLLTLIHKADQLVAKTLPSNSKDGVRWRKSLNLIQKDVNELKTHRPALIVVAPSETGSMAAEDVTTVLLNDPLGFDAAKRSALKSRWKTAQTNQLKYTSKSQSPFLAQLDATLLEYRTPPTEDIEPIIGDVVIEVSSSPILSSPHRFGNKLAVTTSSLDSSSVEALAVNPSLALDAFDALASSPKSIKGIEVYQHNFLLSRMHALQDAITSILKTPSFASVPITSLTQVEILKSNTARSVLLRICAALQSHLSSIRSDSQSTQSLVDSLEVQASEAKEYVTSMVLGETEKAVPESLNASEKEIRSYLEFHWLKLPFKVDFLSEDIARVLRSVWCRDLERHLIFSTGRLLALQASLQRTTHTSLATLPAHFQSAILDNSISQLTTSLHRLRPNSLLSPLSSRLTQLLKYPTASLHASAQRAVLYSSTFTLATAGGSYGSWMTGYVGSETALGVGLLAAAVGLRWGVRKWEKAKRDWWRNWERVGEGLERDLKAELTRTLEEHVVAAPTRAAAELREKISTELEKVGTLELEVKGLRKEIEETL